MEKKLPLNELSSQIEAEIAQQAKKNQQAIRDKYKLNNSLPSGRKTNYGFATEKYKFSLNK